MGSFGWTEIILVILIIVVLFGAKKIPELMSGIGKGIKEFKKASNGETEEKTETKDEKKS
jgi:sec-independent protein translocase protein TatA